MTDLPRPDISVTNKPIDSTSHGVDVVISRDNKAHSYSGKGSDVNGAVKDVVEKILGDHRSAEYIPKG